MGLRKALLFSIQILTLTIVFISSAWIKVGLYAEEEFMRDFFLYLYGILPNVFFFWMLPFILTFCSSIATYRISGMAGMISVMLIFSGAFLFNTLVGNIALILGCIIGVFAPLRGQV